RKHAERGRARRIVDGSVEREPRVAVRLEIGWLHLETVCKPNRFDDNSGCGWDPDFPSGPLRGRQCPRVGVLAADGRGVLDRAWTDLGSRARARSAACFDADDPLLCFPARI